ncbi:uncharacterized protein BDW47DRAFT_105383 [Aspergillus candidus]|uniref:Uncharacterized protein n=1 Tax=Aspergillus candidus TaxID=41067 RepID=A0A2I2FBX5_ASPCN|nr:hypothetical protein BDW47DRAFT_105383 [Aspergillus candidus]PLB38133.1 hypothetical protein BDW47DRAFT_105383 [Aspergillus candidus]
MTPTRMISSTRSFRLPTRQRSLFVAFTSTSLLFSFLLLPQSSCTPLSVLLYPLTSCFRSIDSPTPSWRLAMIPGVGL